MMPSTRAIPPFRTLLGPLGTPGISAGWMISTLWSERASRVANELSSEAKGSFWLRFAAASWERTAARELLTNLCLHP